MSTEPDTESLLKEALAGDREALGRVLESYRGRLSSFVVGHLRAPLSSQVEVDDVVQEAAARAIDGIQRFRGDDSEAFYKWLRGIATNVVLELASRHGRRKATRLPTEVPGSALSQSRVLQREDRFDRLRSALDTLSPDHREVILLARIQRLPIVEVAKRMNRTPEATTQLLWRAVQKLRVSFGHTESLHLPRRSLTEEGADHGE